MATPWRPWQPPAARTRAISTTTTDSSVKVAVKHKKQREKRNKELGRTTVARQYLEEEQGPQDNMKRPFKIQIRVPESMRNGRYSTPEVPTIEGGTPEAMSKFSKRKRLASHDEEESRGCADEPDDDHDNSEEREILRRALVVGIHEDSARHPHGYKILISKSSKITEVIKKELESWQPGPGFKVSTRPGQSGVWIKPHDSPVVFLITYHCRF